MKTERLIYWTRSATFTEIAVYLFFVFYLVETSLFNFNKCVRVKQPVSLFWTTSPEIWPGPWPRFFFKISRASSAGNQYIITNYLKSS